MTYPHMTVLFWLYMGLATATILVQQAERETEVVATTPGRAAAVAVATE
jgi:hypothetical protein